MSLQETNTKNQSSEALVDYPVFSVSMIRPLVHCIHFCEPLLGDKSGGICEIWGKLDDSNRFTYLSSEKESPYTISYSDAARNKTVCYKLRWQYAENEYSQWSEIQKVRIE
jgi:hypothetical protein